MAAATRPSRQGTKARALQRLPTPADDVLTSGIARTGREHDDERRSALRRSESLFFNRMLKPSPHQNTQARIDLSAAILLKHGDRVETTRAAALRRARGPVLTSPASPSGGQEPGCGEGWPVFPRKRSAGWPARPIAEVGRVGRDALREYVRGSLWVLPELSVLAALAAGSLLSLVRVGAAVAAGVPGHRG